jgi:SAM-dependent methyltransferase
MSPPATSAAADELAFWDSWLSTRGGRWPDEFRDRTNPGAPLHWEICETLGTPAGGTAEILDVGAGPLTSLGKAWNGRTIRVTPIDPLAPEYDRLLARHGITPPVRTVAGDATTLLERFGPDRFDLVHGRNAIDHTPDPPHAIAQMVAVARPGGAVYLSHARNEAERQGYSGMHGWNFDGRSGPGGTAFIAWSGSRTVDIGAMLPTAASVEVRLLPEWINVVIRKGRRD